MARFLERDAIIIDTLTGLCWTKDAALSEFPLTWSEALAFVRGLNRSGRFGYRDWRLPNRRELYSLISHETVNPCLPDGHPFVNVFSGYYWTSTSCAQLPNQAWYVHLGGARVFKGMKQNSYMLWPVRSDENRKIEILQTGQRRCYDENGDHVSCKQTGQDGEYRIGRRYGTARFVEKNVVIYDAATDLIWLKDGNIAKRMLDWKSACDLVKKMNRDRRFGYNDWRIPGIIELEILTDMEQHSPALPFDHPFYNVEAFYWSSTTSQYNSQYAWTLYLQDGAVGVGSKSLPEFYLWPVRSNGSGS